MLKPVSKRCFNDVSLLFFLLKVCRKRRKFMVCEKKKEGRKESDVGEEESGKKFSNEGCGSGSSLQ